MVLTDMGSEFARSRIYLDHAATSFPKAPGVLEALTEFTTSLGASAGRGAYREALAVGSLIRETREALAELFHITDDPNHLIFTLNATDALNLALKGLLRPGDHVVTSCLDHNSILRPLHALAARRGINVTKVPCSPQGVVDPDDVKAALRPETRLIALIHASNVLGTLVPIREIGRLARTAGVFFLVDAAQTAGTYPVDVEADRIDLLAFPGHKALLGPLGTGGLYVREGVPLESVREGGTGSVSEQDIHPEFLPDRYEAGSHNALGLAGLRASVRFLLAEGVSTVHERKTRLLGRFLDGLREIPGVVLYGRPGIAGRVPVVSVNLRGVSPQEVATRLDEDDRIQVRAGVHCAPLAHRAMGTWPTGAVRFSLGTFTTEDEIRQTLTALTNLAARFVGKARVASPLPREATAAGVSAKAAVR